MIGSIQVALLETVYCHFLVQPIRPSPKFRRVVLVAIELRWLDVRTLARLPSIAIPELRLGRQCNWYERLVIKVVQEIVPGSRLLCFLILTDQSSYMADDIRILSALHTGNRPRDDVSKEGVLIRSPGQPKAQVATQTAAHHAADPALHISDLLIQRIDEIENELFFGIKERIPVCHGRIGRQFIVVALRGMVGA